MFKNPQFHLSADDTNIFYSSSCFEELQTTVNKELNKVSKWFCANRFPSTLKKLTLQSFTQLAN